MPHCNFLLLLLSLQTRMMNQRNLKVKPGEGTVIYRSSTHCLVTVSVKNEYILHCQPLGLNTAISRKVVAKNAHTTIPKGNMGYVQYTVPDTVAVEPTFVAFL